jgi:hypothetical protein
VSICIDVLVIDFFYKEHAGCLKRQDLGVAVFQVAVEKLRSKDECKITHSSKNLLLQM